MNSRESPLGNAKIPFLGDVSTSRSQVRLHRNAMRSGEEKGSIPLRGRSSDRGKRMIKANGSSAGEESVISGNVSQLYWCDDPGKVDVPSPRAEVPEGMKEDDLL